MKKKSGYSFAIFIAIGVVFGWCIFLIGKKSLRGIPPKQEKAWTEQLKKKERKKEKEKKDTKERAISPEWWKDVLYQGWEREKKNTIKEENYDLTTEEARILYEHMFRPVVGGFWRFSERIVALEENPNAIGGNANFSDAGVEVIQTKVHIFCNFNQSIDFFGPIMEKTYFTDAQDVYLYGAYGGFARIQFPAYRIEKMDTGTIFLDNLYSETGYEEVELDWMKGFWHVSYGGMETKGGSRCIGYYPINDIYFDPNNTKIIYVDFCGLWKLYRL